MPSVCDYLEDVGPKKPCIVEGLLVPAPAFSGQVEFKRPRAISFAPVNTEPASSTTGGTLMAEFSAEPGILRDCRDTFPAENFVELVITVCAGVFQSFSILHSHVHSGRVSKSGLPQWRTSSRTGTT